MAPAARKAVLLAWRSPECDSLAWIWRQCGLEDPFPKSPPLSEGKLLPGKVPLQGSPPWDDLPDFFDACSRCGASLLDIDWPWLVENCSPPWKAAGSGREPTAG